MANDQKKCPKCAELIKRDASKCRYCGHEFGFKFPDIGCGGTLGLLVLTLAIMSQCDSKTSDQSKPSPPSEIDKRIAYEAMVERYVKARLKDPDSAKFIHYANGCGLVNSKNSFGGMTGDQRFIAGTNGFVLLEEDSSKSFRTIWNDRCTK